MFDTEKGNELNLKIVNFFKFKYEGHIKAIRNSALLITVLVVYVLSYGFLKTDDSRSWITVVCIGSYLKIMFLFNYFYLAPASQNSKISKRFILYYTLQYQFVAISSIIFYCIFINRLLVFPEQLHSMSFFAQISLIVIINLLVFHAAFSNYFIIKTLNIESGKNFYQLESLQKEVNIWQQQINPHFIGNALGNLNGLIRSGNSDKALDYNANISELFMAQMKFANLESISVEEEVSWIVNYLEIEKKRVGYHFEYSIEFENLDIKLQQIPPMLLQPLIENSLVHGFNNDLNRKWHLGIKFHELGENTISIDLEDNGLGEKSGKTKHKKSISINNIHKRIELLNSIGKFDIDFIQLISENGVACRLVIKLNS